LPACKLGTEREKEGERERETERVSETEIVRNGERIRETDRPQQFDEIFSDLEWKVKSEGEDQTCSHAEASCDPQTFQ
jgi:hypothetical protein